MTVEKNEEEWRGKQKANDYNEKCNKLGRTGGENGRKNKEKKQ